MNVPRPERPRACLEFMVSSLSLQRTLRIPDSVHLRTSALSDTCRSLQRGPCSSRHLFLYRSDLFVSKDFRLALRSIVNSFRRRYCCFIYCVNGAMRRSRIVQFSFGLWYLKSLAFPFHTTSYCLSSRFGIKVQIKGSRHFRFTQWG